MKSILIGQPTLGAADASGTETDPSSTIREKNGGYGGAPSADLKQTFGLSWKTMYADLDNPQSISWQAILIFVPLICVASLVYDVIRLGGDDEAWIITGAIGYLVAVLCLLIFRSVLKKVEGPKSFLVLICYAWAGLVRGLVVYFVGEAFGVVPSDELAFRIMGSTFLAVWVLVGANIVVVSANRYSEAVAALRKELTSLAATKNALARNIEVVRSQLYSRINNDLLPAVQNLVARLESSTQKPAGFAVAAVQDLIESVVRPLSHRVIDPSYLSEVELSDHTATAKPVASFFRGRVQLSQIILPSLVATTTIVTSLPSSLVTMQPIETLLIAVFGWNSIFLYLTAAKYLLGNLRVYVWAAALISFALPMSLGVLLYLAKWGSFVGIKEIHGLQLYLMAATLSFFAFWFQVLESKRRESLQKLDEITEDQRRLVSALRQEVWVLQRHLASTLHGPVQAVLFASLYRFSQSEKLQDDRVTELVENLEAAIEQLQHPPGLDSRSFDSVFDEICDFWSGVCEVQSSLDGLAMSELSANPKALSCVLEVIREGINNAVRHAEAKKISVNLTVEGEIVWLVILNDGKPLNPIRTQGLGSKLVSDVTHSWQLLNCEGAVDGFVTELRASIVLLKVDFADQLLTPLA